MAVPIKNGVVIYLSEYHEMMRADVYEMEGVLIFIGSLYPVNNGDTEGQEPFIDRHADVIVGSRGMNRTSMGYEMIVTPKQNVKKYKEWTD